MATKARSKQFLQIVMGLVLVTGLAWRIYVAIAFQSRAWIDELWVVLNPAFALLHYGSYGTTAIGGNWLYGGGVLSVDWTGWQIRSWVPPGLVFIWLKILSLIGIQGGSTVIALLRVVMSVLGFSALVAYAAVLGKRFGLRQGVPLLPAAMLLLTPEYINYGATFDLSVLGLPFLLFGIALFFWDERKKRVAPFYKSKLFYGALLLALASVIRFQFALVPIFFFFLALFKKDCARVLSLFLAGTVVFVFDVVANSLLYGHFIVPIYNYFMLNTAGGLASSFGTTPFYFAFDLLLRFMMLPALLALVFTLRFSLRRDVYLVGAALVLFVGHMVVGHKEYRFFYAPAILLTGVGTAGFSAWLELRPKLDRWIMPIFLAVFLVFAVWRADRKVAWAQYQVPAKLETLAGMQPDIKGLLTFGWGGILQGGQFSFHRALPYVFVEKRADLATYEMGDTNDLNRRMLGRKQAKLKPKDFNYVVAPANQAAPCKQVVVTEQGACLWRCTESEITALLK